MRMFSLGLIHFVLLTTLLCIFLPGDNAGIEKKRMGQRKIKVQTGTIRGVTVTFPSEPTLKYVEAFLGIDYGSLKRNVLFTFHPPSDPIPHKKEKVKDSTTFKGMCPQSRYDISHFFSSLSGAVLQEYIKPYLQEEDCLSLNVYSPIPEVDKRRLGQRKIPYNNVNMRGLSATFPHGASLKHVEAYLGIQYGSLKRNVSFTTAHAPQDPVSHTKDKIVYCSSFKGICPQPGFDMKFHDKYISDVILKYFQISEKPNVQKDDCLTLNLYTPIVPGKSSKYEESKSDPKVIQSLHYALRIYGRKKRRSTIITLSGNHMLYKPKQTKKGTFMASVKITDSSERV